VSISMAASRSSIGMAAKFDRLWATKNKNDEWWSSFITSPLGIAINLVVVEWPILTPNRITTLSFFSAMIGAICILFGTYTFAIMAVIFLNLSHVLDCMDGQMAKFRGISTPFGSYYDKVTDQLKVFMFVGASSFAAYQQTQDVTVVFLGFTAVAFYFIRVYVKYLTIFIEMESDSKYLKACSEVADVNVRPRSSRPAGPGAGIQNNLIWFLREQRKFFLFNEAVFIFLICLGLLLERLTEILWILAASQVYYGLRRSYQRGCQIYYSQHAELLEPIEK